MRLVGDDSVLLSYKKEDIIEGDDSQTLAELSQLPHPRYYVINDFSKDEIFLNNHIKGDIYYSVSGNEILSKGTIFTPLIETDFSMDVKNISIDLSYSEIDLTTIDDTIPKYVKSLGDAKGSMIIQVTSEALRNKGSLYNKFIKMSIIDTNTGDNIIIDKIEESLFIKDILNSKDTGEKVNLFAEIDLYNISLGANTGTAQEYTSNFRFCGANPILMVIKDGETN